MSACLDWSSPATKHPLKRPKRPQAECRVIWIPIVADAVGVFRRPSKPQFDICLEKVLSWRSALYRSQWARAVVRRIFNKSPEWSAKRIPYQPNAAWVETRTPTSLSPGEAQATSSTSTTGLTSVWFQTMPSPWIVAKDNRSSERDDTPSKVLSTVLSKNELPTAVNMKPQLDPTDTT